jgi:uroporphyrinogen-III decarboxylase
MCNLYDISTNQEAMHALSRAVTYLAGNLQPSVDMSPDRKCAGNSERPRSKGDRSLNLGHAIPAPCNEGRT